MTSSPAISSDLPGHPNAPFTSPSRNQHQRQQQLQQQQQSHPSTSHSASATRHDRILGSEQRSDDTERHRHSERAAGAKPAFMTAQPQTHKLSHSNAYVCEVPATAQRQQQQQQTNETTSLMNEFGLVAEAVKRAEMAIMMRDMEGVELT